MLEISPLKQVISNETIMKTLHCSDAGFDCDGVIQADTDQEVLSGATRHARDVHGVEATPEMTEQLRGLIRDE